MRDSVFLDTNILLYLYSNTETDKRDTSLLILTKYICLINTQALNEFSNVLLRKYKISSGIVKESVINISKSCRVRFINEQVIHMALDLNNRYGYAYYDCLMLASALESNCKILFSEDMSNRQIIENKLDIVNPYL